MPDASAQPFSEETAAAVDLGSNSFHMVVARVLDGGELQVIDRIKHRVRLAGGLDADGRLTAEAQDRALESLRIMGQRVQGIDRSLVRAVGTNTLRKARNALPFLLRASQALGHRIDVISGREEARLIWAGVSHGLPDNQRTLIADIGGGSTEVIVGEGTSHLALDSLYMGCVSFSQRFFPAGRLTAKAFAAAHTAARLELQPVERRFRALGWERAIGSSGTIRAVEQIVMETGLSPEGMTLPGIERLIEALIKARRVEKLNLPGLSEPRRAVIPGGLAIVHALFTGLGITRMQASDSALREGVLLDLLGRRYDRDMREISVARFAERFGVDAVHAANVRRVALAFFDSVAEKWGLLQDPSWRQLIGWAADLHEVGIFVSWSGYHKHGAYVLRNADMAGFSRAEQEGLAALVLSHRGKLSPDRIASVYRGPMEPMLRLCVVLRLARRLCRSRDPEGLPATLRLRGAKQLLLGLPAGALADRALTRADLAEEAQVLRAVGLDLRLVEVPEVSGDG